MMLDFVLRKVSVGVVSRSYLADLDRYVQNQIQRARLASERRSASAERETRTDSDGGRSFLCALAHPRTHQKRRTWRKYAIMQPRGGGSSRPTVARP